MKTKKKRNFRKIQKKNIFSTVKKINKKKSIFGVFHLQAVSVDFIGCRPRRMFNYAHYDFIGSGGGCGSVRYLNHNYTNFVFRIIILEHFHLSFTFSTCRNY